VHGIAPSSRIRKQGMQSRFGRYFRYVSNCLWSRFHTIGHVHPCSLAGAPETISHVLGIYNRIRRPLSQKVQERALSEWTVFHIQLSGDRLRFGVRAVPLFYFHLLTIFKQLQLVSATLTSLPRPHFSQQLITHANSRSKVMQRPYTCR